MADVPADPVSSSRFPLLRNRLKERLAARELSLCLRVTMTATTDLAFLARAAGFDALYVDMEHSTASASDAAALGATAAALGVTPLVRVSSVDDDSAGRLLDAGCQGIIAPHVESAEQAGRLVERCLFPPLGRRSSYGPARLLDYQDVPPAELAEHLTSSALLCVMLESEAAVSAADEIAAVPGIDLVLVGTQDLTAGLGIPGRVDDPAVVRMYEQVAAATAAAGAAFGVAGVSDSGVLARYVELGAVFVSAGTDADLLRAAATARVEQLRASLRS